MLLIRLREWGGIHSALVTVEAKLVEALEPLPAVRLAVLFGSHARGRASRHSDIDLAVLLAPDTPQNRKATRRATLALAQTIDIVFTADAPPLLRMEIARHGKVLIERQPFAWANFKAKAMIDWGDWGPHARRMWKAAIQRLREEMGRGST
ncbi:MAG: type VII toxin-antitoxin system MntA family adenylyltransferase antitoxin [Myxococcota bacterium]